MRPPFMEQEETPAPVVRERGTMENTTLGVVECPKFSCTLKDWRVGSGGGDVCPGPVSISCGGMPRPPPRARGEVGEFNGKGCMGARKNAETLGDLLVGSGGGSPPLPSPVYPYDAPAGAQCAECTRPVLFKYDAESSIGAV